MVVYPALFFEFKQIFLSSVVYTSYNVALCVTKEKYSKVSKKVRKS